MNPGDNVPKGKLARSVVGGKTAARVGSQYLKYTVEKPFLSPKKQADAKRKFASESARTLFEGLCRLKGTALKIAQLLSLELDMLPPEIRAQFERSYNQVPPINRALARKLLQNAYGVAPEKIFASFESKAFAAASLGQVHRATAPDGTDLALKIQYPGIHETIRSDVAILQRLLRPFAEAEHVRLSMEEIEARLMEETDYLQEAVNATFFREKLQMADVCIPHVHDPWCTASVLCLTRLPGQPLNEWLADGPDAANRDRTAQLLQDIFTRSLYELHAIHADPNPGNYIVLPDGCPQGLMGLVDFGCIKRFDASFTDLVRRMPQVLCNGDNADAMDLFQRIGTIPENMNTEMEQQIRKALGQYAAWFSRLYQHEYFDFSREKDFISQGKDISRNLKQVFRTLRINPNFIFLDRTRYGLLRLFERMEARVCFRNGYEWEG